MQGLESQLRWRGLQGLRISAVGNKSVSADGVLSKTKYRMEWTTVNKSEMGYLTSEWCVLGGVICQRGQRS